ncbi:MAG TPA: hypothetical protein VET66_06505, partial [Steroidobacteraceae bacterium]|nr:hypothetical protein [Steroidobacteraceae bacterium]
VCMDGIAIDSRAFARDVRHAAGRCGRRRRRVVGASEADAQRDRRAEQQDAQTGSVHRLSLVVSTRPGGDPARQSRAQTSTRNLC